MIGERKPFSPGLLRRHDPRARRLVKAFFLLRGVTLIDHPNDCAVDLTTEDGKLTVEVEHRPVWDQWTKTWQNKFFPYDDINILERKQHLFIKGENHYCILSKHWDKIAFAQGKTLKKYMKPKYRKEIPNRFMKKNEYAFKVPHNEFEFYTIEL